MKKKHPSLSVILLTSKAPGSPLSKAYGSVLPWVLVQKGKHAKTPEFLQRLTCSLPSELWSLWLLSCRGRRNHPCLVNLAEILQISHRIMAMRLCEIRGVVCRHTLKKSAVTSSIQDREYKPLWNGQQRDLSSPCSCTSYLLVEKKCVVMKSKNEAVW